MLIFLVDDDMDDIEIFSEALLQIDETISFDYALNGKLAVEKLCADGSQKPDIVFMDINMPVMNGWDSLKILKEHKLCSDIPVIIYSTSSHPSHEQMAAELSALGFFVKPDNYTRLKQILAAVILHLRNGDIGKIRDAISSPTS